MNTTNSPGPVLEALGSITYYAIKMRPLVPTYLHLIISSIFPIYAAAHASLRRPVSAAPAKSKKRSGKGVLQEKDDGESSSAIETLTASDAILFPILAGFTLTGLYLVIKWLEDPRILNQILGYYFSWIGIFFSFKFVQDVLYFTRSWIFPTQFSWYSKLYKFDHLTNSFVAVTADGIKEEVSKKDPVEKARSSLPSWLRKTYMGVRRRALQEIVCTTTVRKPMTPLRLSLSATWLDLIAGAVALFVAFHTTLGIKTPWYLTNLQGFAFCYGSLQYMSPGTSAVASLLLSLLFIYDIYMVFYTPMMVTVATKLDVPIKLLFPKKVDGVKAMAMLGLGDIVVPGIVMAFALRFDLYRHYVKIGKDKKTNVLNDSKDAEDKKDTRPTYVSARGSWAERTYTAKHLWSPILRAKNFPKPYFTATMVGYIMGMLTTVLVMTVFDHAQPALLYLVPGVLLSFWGTALVKGEIKLAWNFDEAAEEKEKDKKKEEQEKAKKDDKKHEKAEKSGKEPVKSTEEKEVESGLKPFFTFNLYFPKPPISPTSGEATSVTGDRNKAEQNNEITGKDSNKLEDAETESESSTGSQYSTTSDPEIVSQEEALEGYEDEAQLHADLKADTETRGSKESKGEKDVTVVVPVVSTKDDEGGAQAVKRRRRG